MQTTTAGRHSSPLRLAITGATGFLVLGILVSVLGPTMPELRARHGLDATGGAWLLASFSVGSAIGVGIAGRYRHQALVSHLLTVGALALAVGCAVVPVAPSGVVVAACLLVAGVGFGMVDLLLNLVLATSYGGSGGAMLSALSAAFGVSAVLTPLLVGRSPTNLSVPYLLCALGALALLVLTTTLRSAPTTPPHGRRATRSELRLMTFLGGVLLGYVALEAGVSGWETTHLRAVTSMSAGAAANAVAYFWLGLTIGRLAGAPLALRWRPGRLALTSLALATLTVSLASYTPSAVWAYAVTGLVLAPVFPAVITWYAAAVPSGRGATRVFAAGVAGPVIGAPLIGMTTDATSAAAVPWVLAGIGLVTTLAALVCHRRTEPAGLAGRSR